MLRPRHFKLESAGHAGAVRFLSGLHVNLEDGKKTSWVTVTRTGTFHDPRYGKFDITRQMLLSMVENFDRQAYGQDVFIDVAHRPDNGAAAKITKLTVEGDRLRAQVEWTPYGIDAVKNKGYIYLSAEFHENFKDNESGQVFGPVLLGAGLTVRPVIKRLDPIRLSCDPDGDTPTYIHPELQSTLLQEIETMWKSLSEKLALMLAAVTMLAEPVRAQLIDAFEAAVKPVTDEAQAKALMEAFAATGKKLAEAHPNQTVKLDISLPSGGLTAEDVKKLLAEQAAEAAANSRKLAEAKDANLKLLADTINAASGIDDETKKTLAAEVADLITPDMSADQVKRLAENQIKHGNDLAVARQLSAMGYTVAGTPHISVDDSNSVKALQEQFDKRLGLATRPATERFANTGGVLLSKNKDFAEIVLAQYDAEHAVQLRTEHKRLAAGDGVISDVAVPNIFERTVIREALYQMIGLQFVDVGTHPFTTSVTIPYSYRDTSAAGRANTRVYEGGAIPRAGVKQTNDTAYPIPQKLAFEVSDEMRYLTSNGQLAWDAVAENQRNASRIIGEDGEKLIFDELLNAADQYLSAAVVDEATATADGAKSIFKLDNFPVVRPKKIYDLAGAQIGSTLHPIVVKSNNVAITEWDGTGTQGAGLYYWMDYNLGEVHFVDKDGAASAPTNTHAIVTSYSYATNVYKFDTDLGSATAKAHWDTFLYRFGLRKAVIEDDRYYSANFFLASGTAHTQIEQAEQFGANSKRPGTDLSMDGNLGRVKDVPGFKSKAPGLNMGDQRVIVGERSNTRFRMLKPWSMGELENQKDANGRNTGKKEAYGDQFIALHTPIPLKGALTSIVLYSATARADR